MLTRLRTLALGCTLATLAAPIWADNSLLGKIEFPNSGAAAAQEPFLAGVLYMHNFEYDEAVEEFKKAQEIDPGFALAYWGEAMAYNHPIWFRQSKQPAEDALGRLARTPEERAAKAPTQREKDYLRAVEILYGTVEPAIGVPKDDRDDLYRDAMRRLHETYPDDDEATTFYGLSILGSAHEGRDFAAYMQAAAVLTQVWDKNREHPGAAHYLIHSYDDAIHAPLGLPMARAYSKIAPAAAHAQHMTSHIFVAMGMWDDLVRANEIAIEVENRSHAERDEPDEASGHYPHWLEYGYLQQGRYKDAAALMEKAYARMNEGAKAGERGYYGQMFARYVIDTEQWDAAERWAIEYEPSQNGARDYFFTVGYAAIRRGDREAAEAAFQSMRETVDTGTYPAFEETKAVLEQQASALLELQSGDRNKAIEALRETAKAEVALNRMFGPPNVVKPTAELLGDEFLNGGQHAEAKAAYEEQLKLTPLRTSSLRGLARALEGCGDAAGAAAASAKLDQIWDNADDDVRRRELKQIAGQ